MDETTMFKKICIATDGSEESLKAAKLAITLAKINSAVLYIIYVVDDKVIDKILTMTKKTVEEVREEYAQSGNINLQYIQKLANKEGVLAEIKLDEGYPNEKIIDYTRKIKSDLLIIGHHYRRHVRSLYLRGKTVRIIELSDCPILIVK